MPINIGSANWTLRGALTSNVFAIESQTDAAVLTVTNAGQTTLSSIPGCIVLSSTDPGWVSFSSSITSYLDTAPVNRQSAYNTSTKVYTAPVAGLYLFTFSAYTNKTGAGNGDYFHPMFLVNGGYGQRRPNGYGSFKVRHYNETPDGYVADAQMEELVYLQANDTVQPSISSSTTAIHFYPYYTFFTVTLVG